MSRTLIRSVVIALIFLALGVACAAAVLAYLPDPGSAPAIFDDFNWSSTSNGFWHVNAIGATAPIKNGVLTLKGDSIELDRRLQTDPKQTVVIAKVKATHFHKFGMGIGIYHAGTMGLEFDDDGVKCGRGTDFGWKIDVMKGWTLPPVNQWFYLKLVVNNPYPNPKDLQWAELHLPAVKTVTITCSVFDSHARLLARMTPVNPPPNGHYVSLDEVFMRTWDSGNDYQVDWFYAGPPSGIPGPVSLRT